MSQHDEIVLFWKRTVHAIDAVLACLDEAPATKWNWRPVEPSTSLYALAAHVIGSTEEHILEGICDEPVGRDRDAEFASAGVDVIPIRASWQDVQTRIKAALDALPEGALDMEYDDPRLGRMTAREILLITAQHCAEHRGQAELTLQLLMA
jgi:uncharacterized damage-inducible protein DinB